MGCKLAWALVLWLCHVAVAVANAVFGAHDDMGAGGVRALNRVRVWGLKYGFLGFADGLFVRELWLEWIESSCCGCAMWRWRWRMRCLERTMTWVLGGSGL
jgi:hypothetical protein